MESLLNKDASGMGFAGSAAKAGWKVSAPQTIDEQASGNPRTFDIEQVSEGGGMKLVRCYYQIADKFILCTDEPEFAPAYGILYAVIDTSLPTGSVTAQIDFEYDPGTPELFGIALYRLDGDGNVLCDCRGSQVVIYG